MFDADVILDLLAKSEGSTGTKLKYIQMTTVQGPPKSSHSGTHHPQLHSSHRPPSKTKKRVKDIGFRKIFYLCNAVLTARHIDCSYLPPNYHIIVKMNKTNTQELALTRCELLLGVCWAVVGLVVTSLSLHLFFVPSQIQTA